MKEAENFAKYPTQPYRHSHNWVSDIAADMHLILVLPGYWSIHCFQMYIIVLAWISYGFAWGLMGSSNSQSC
ncbi:hypothetical protein BofuT4_uP152270.1 [Botrytis cinerea T4]|uniref:Uncharacterized protein n=1 Tax=Botryotinia fuckeliana (strain T4) TaxID=999810 RepID=G2YWU7_BOTF4|nr:hypothetical protein BofuT4_uP152270.1 [Botrytis cinerea T4]